MKILAIDPSINETGWAVAQGRDVIASGVLRSPEKEQKRALPLRILGNADRLKRLLLDHPNIGLVVIEISGKITYQRFKNQTRVRGADMKGDALEKMSMVIGAFTIIAHTQAIPVAMIEAVKWKGGMNKNVALSLTGKANHNEADAVLLARWAIYPNILPLLMAEAGGKQ